ncbi:MAG TPA: hypothetical protein VN369_00090, partial [Terriglobales bacterium]|nr:hypothetical protein [Terriglobales bacterium]
RLSINDFIDSLSTPPQAECFIFRLPVSVAACFVSDAQFFRRPNRQTPFWYRLRNRIAPWCDKVTVSRPA